MNLSVKVRGPIVEGIESRIEELIDFMKKNKSQNEYGSREISPYDYSILIGELEYLLEQFYQD